MEIKKQTYTHRKPLNVVRIGIVLVMILIILFGNFIELAGWVLSLILTTMLIKALDKIDYMLNDLVDLMNSLEAHKDEKET